MKLRALLRRLFRRALPGPTVRAVVSRVTVRKRGEVSVVLRFDLEDRDTAANLTPGTVVELLRP